MFSHSRVECYKSCPYKYKLKYVDKLKTYEDCTQADNPLYCGLALHKYMETSSQDEMYKEYISHYPIIENLHERELFKLYHITDGLEVPKGIHELKIETDEFVGYIDFLKDNGDGTYDIYDWKYSNNISKYENSPQLSIYKYFVEKQGYKIRKLYYVFFPKSFLRLKTNETEKQLRTRIKNDLDKKGINFVEVEYNSAQVEEYLKLTKEIPTKQDFPKCQSKLCDWCEYQNYCEKGDTYMLLPSSERVCTEQLVHNSLWLYGEPRTGKTTFANGFDKPLMLNTDGNVFNVDAPRIRLVDTKEGRQTKLAWEMFKDVVEELEKNDNDFDTIILDLVEDMFNSCTQYVCKEEGVPHESELGFGKGYALIEREFLTTMKKFTNLNYKNIVLISHEDSTRDKTSKSGKTETEIKPNLKDKYAKKLSGMVDLVARTVIEDGKYMIQIPHGDNVFGGARTPIHTDYINNNAQEFMEVMNKGREELNNEFKNGVKEQTTTEEVVEENNTVEEESVEENTTRGRRGRRG